VECDWIVLFDKQSKIMTYIWYKSANNVVSYLVSAISSNSTNMIVNDGWIFPSSFPYLLTIEQQLNGQTTVREIVEVTGKTWNTLTINRAVESCVSDDTATPKTMSQIAHNFEAGAVVSLVMTAWTLKDVQDEMDSQSWRISDAEDEIDELTDLINTLEDDIANL